MNYIKKSTSNRITKLVDNKISYQKISNKVSQINKLKKQYNMHKKDQKKSSLKINKKYYKIMKINKMYLKIN